MKFLSNKNLTRTDLYEIIFKSDPVQLDLAMEKEFLNNKDKLLEFPEIIS